MRAIGTFGGSTSEATAINDNGLVTGNAKTASLNYQAFIYDNGTLTNIGVLIPNLPNSFGFGINNSGHVVGAAYNNNYSSPKAFHYDGVGIVLLGNLGGGNSFALAINNQNTIIGYSSVVGGAEHAFFRQGGTLVDMGTLGGGYSYALDNNDAEIIVGGAFADQGNLVYHAFVYQNGTMMDLNNKLDSSGTGWVLVEARAINNAGQITGVGRRNGQVRGFLLNPNVPGPTFTGIGISGADVGLTFTTSQFTRYRVEKRNTLAPVDAWTETSDVVTGTGDEMTWTDVDALSTSTKLYRIKVSQPQ
jgi:chitinase